MLRNSYTKELLLELKLCFVPGHPVSGRDSIRTSGNGEADTGTGWHPGSGSLWSCVTFLLRCTQIISSPPQLQILSDFSYGWQLVHSMTPLMQEQVCCVVLFLRKWKFRRPCQGEDWSADGGAVANNLPEVGGGHGGGDGEAWRGREQGALPCVSVLLIYLGYLYQDCLAGRKI